MAECQWSYVILVLEFVVDEAFDDAGFAGAAIAEEDHFEGPLSDGGRSDGHIIFKEWIIADRIAVK